ncbi:sulfite exporter TauE/SafE family protein [Thiobacter aerophilum]|uniref:Probable membrane transporter protein n=1 Tax=Thiobacter aerophilum TaxID=3121275 RepID=A0ABV0EG01_9BURK
MLIEWFAYVALGACAGFLAGLLGVGGGLIIVPVLTFIFTAHHFPETYVVHLALGTSLASIVFTSVSSFRAHHAHGAVNWHVWRRITPGIITGTLAGSVLAAWLSTVFLKGFFVVFLFYVGTQMLLDIRPKAARALPGRTGMFAAGNVIGAVSSLVGIGGGTLSVPFMTWCNVKLHEAIGTSAAIGFPIAVAGAIGYVANGLLVEGLPAGSVGFVYLPALIAIAVTSILTAPLGARLAHRLPVKKLKKIFALLLYTLGLRMAWTLI